MRLTFVFLSFLLVFSNYVFAQETVVQQENTEKVEVLPQQVEQKGEAVQPSQVNGIPQNPTETQAQPTPQQIKPVQGLNVQRPQLGRPLASPQFLSPPVILVKGINKDFVNKERISIETVKVDTQVALDFVITDTNVNEKLYPRAVHLPNGAIFKAEGKDEPINDNSNKVSFNASLPLQATFSWKPIASDVGFHGVAFEVYNSKGLSSKLLMFFYVVP